ncbi:MAG: TonB-dependent receptor plug domain-containing protein, partial [Proteobacteria bacterium]|nr:TonB-dependent receptor plug domain-containing protein [Pseudomonadota bacterium]
MRPCSPRRPVAAATAVLLSCACTLAVPAAAQTAPSPGTPPPAVGADVQPVVALPPVNVQASADASAAGLSPPFAGGEVARGGRAGFLGNLDYMASPFATMNYTAALIEDQQARSVADVLLNDPAVRNARGFGNFQELYVIRGFPVYSDDMSYNGLYGL